MLLACDGAAHTEVLDATGPIINTAAVVQSDQVDVDLTNNQATVILLPEQPAVDLVLEKTVTPGTTKLLALGFQPARVPSESMAAR